MRHGSLKNDICLFIKRIQIINYAADVGLECQYRKYVFLRCFHKINHFKRAF